jgi:hypothetical protein
MLVEEMKSSSKYKEENFGQPVGSGWFELIKEVMAESKVTNLLAASYMISIITSPEASELEEWKNLEPKKFVEKLIKRPGVFEHPLMFLYWGIQIGKKLAEIESLERMAEHGEDISKENH